MDNIKPVIKYTPEQYVAMGRAIFHVKDGKAQGLVKYSPWIPGEPILDNGSIVQTLVDLPDGIYKIDTITNLPVIAGKALD